MTDEERRERQRAYQRRYRAHQAGNHELCDPKRRCEVVERAEIAEAEEAGELAHGARGQALWDEWAEQVAGNVLAGIYLEEACRALDRIDLLRRNGEPAAMTEARHQATAMKSMLAEVRKELGIPLPKPSAKPAGEEQASAVPAEPSEGGAEVVDMASGIAARRAKASAG